MTTDWKALLEDLRDVCDRPADDVVTEIVETGRVGDVNRAWHRIVAREGEVDASLGEVASLADFNSTFADPLLAADGARVLAGQRFFGRWGPLIGAALLTRSLPNTYACAKGAQVLALTARMQTDTHRRILETAQFMIAMALEGLEPGGRGLESVRRVRLMHAAIRELIEREYWRVHPAEMPSRYLPRARDGGTRARTVARTRDRLRRLEHGLQGPAAKVLRRKRGRWDPEWGRPINQEDLLGTLMAFGYLPVESLLDGKFIEEGDAGADAFIYVWSVIGRMMGVEPGVPIPETVAEARACWHAIADHQQAYSNEGRGLTRALLKELEMSIPGRILDPFALSTLRAELPDHVQVMLGLTERRWRQAALQAFRWVLRVVGYQKRALDPRRKGEGYGYDAYYRLISTKRQYSDNPFRLPESLSAAWGFEGAEGATGPRWRMRSWTQMHPKLPTADEREGALEAWWAKHENERARPAAPV